MSNREETAKKIEAIGDDIRATWGKTETMKELNSRYYLSMADWHISEIKKLRKNNV